jgi:hypothetical protein
VQLAKDGQEIPRIFFAFAGQAPPPPGFAPAAGDGRGRALGEDAGGEEAGDGNAGGEAPPAPGAGDVGRERARLRRRASLPAPAQPGRCCGNSSRPTASLRSRSPHPLSHTAPYAMPLAKKLDRCPGGGVYSNASGALEKRSGGVAKPWPSASAPAWTGARAWGVGPCPERSGTTGAGRCRGRQRRRPDGPHEGQVLHGNGSHAHRE